MGTIRFVIAESYELAPYVEGLRALERSITYPIDDGRDAFTIDHGRDYHPFFSEMGDARFLITLEDDRVVGSLAGVWREVDADGRAIPSAYLADLKLSPELRGRGVAPRMLWFAFRALFQRQELRGWRLLYGAAMRGEQGDVMRSVRGAHPGHIMDHSAPLALYFVAPETLAQLPPHGPTCAEVPLLDLSPELSCRGVDLVSTAGRKDLRLVHNPGVWSLVHLVRPPGAWGKGLGAYLRRCGERMCAEHPGALACFGLDLRLRAPIVWLRAQGVERGAICTVHAMHVPRPGDPALSSCHAVHLATSAI